MIKFKLKYQISDTTPFEPYEIIANIMLELKDNKYNVEQVTDKSVIFKDNSGGFQSNAAPARLDGGEFVITEDAINGRTVTLYYYYNLFWPLLLITAMIIGVISQGEYLGVLFFGAFFCLALTLDNWRVRNKAKELVRAVV